MSVIRLQRFHAKLQLNKDYQNKSTTFLHQCWAFDERLFPMQQNRHEMFVKLIERILCSKYVGGSISVSHQIRTSGRRNFQLNLSDLKMKY